MPAVEVSTKTPSTRNTFCGIEFPALVTPTNQLSYVFQDLLQYLHASLIFDLVLRNKLTSFVASTGGLRIKVTQRAAQ